MLRLGGRCRPATLTLGSWPIRGIQLSQEGRYQFHAEEFHAGGQEDDAHQGGVEQDGGG